MKSPDTEKSNLTFSLYIAVLVQDPGKGQGRKTFPTSNPEASDFEAVDKNSESSDSCDLLLVSFPWVPPDYILWEGSQYSSTLPNA